ncbi:MAG: hypothetical protein OEY87_05825 [Gammaproteobacteria bacterium]|nr:hypothetical protein [Gammaproteobacteria bacterium]MDH5735625.1 hypothetical protein [Gammaproteobacteria bacterium]
MKNLVAVINGDAQIEYDRSKDLPPHQQQYLEKMDQKMDEGIPHGAGHLFAPDIQQKAQFVADQLVMAIKSDNEQLIAATMAYLATRLPELQQVMAEDKDGEVSIKLIYDRAYAKAEPVKFIRPDQLNS